MTRCSWKDMVAGVKLVMGSYSNIKVTTREDLIFAEALRRRQNGSP